MYRKQNLYHIHSENTPGQAELTQGRVDSGADLTSGQVDPLLKKYMGFL